MTTFGVDVSHHQAGLKLEECKAAGAEFVYAKLTEGATYQDPMFKDWRAAAERLEMLFFAYHFVSTRRAEEQVSNIVRALPSRDIPVGIDHEPTESSRPGFGVARDIVTLLREQGVRVGLLYLPGWYWKDTGSPDLRGWPLIASRYPSKANRGMRELYPGDDHKTWDTPIGGQTPRIWQYASSARFKGHSGNVDVNAYRGTRAELAASGWVKDYRHPVVVTPPQPPPVPAPAKLGVHVGLWGDWNEGPESTGRWSPQWIARKGGLKVYAPPPGKRGRRGIDYALSSAPVVQMRRLEEDVSDHNPILGVVEGPGGQRLTICSFNVMRDRTRAQRRELGEWLEEAGKRYKIDAYALQEVRQYHPILPLIEGYVPVMGTVPEGVEHNALLVREGVEMRNPVLKLTSSVGWITVTGKPHDPSSVALVTLNGWYRLGSAHEAPTVDWVDVPEDGNPRPVPVGPERRIEVRMNSARSLANIARYFEARR